ncbi:MAG: hypothetical protein REI78_16325 [Pedobacter sp.]|nr:hypothetical protein [Pedobacter sp.]MDQ8054597.1 hypothetical protein [Pedobacter sp.]
MKTKISLLLVAIFLSALSCTSANSDEAAGAAPNGKLFLRTVMWGGSLDISWVYLGNDGTIIFNPKNGVNPVNIAVESANNAANTGNYKVVGKNLQITWKNGKTATWSFEKTAGEFSAIDGGLLSSPAALPNNYKLNGQYAAGAVTANLSSSSTLVFTPDGKFKESRYGAVSTAETGASSADSRAGTYNVTGNTLRLKYNSGETYIAVVGIYKISDQLTYFIINNSSYKQQK